MSGATGHRRGIPLRRPATHNVRSVGSDDTEQNRNLDALSDAIGGSPVFPFNEMKFIEVDFTASTLDQTIPHKLTGRWLGWWEAKKTSALFPIIVDQPVSNPKLEDTHIRLISNAVVKTIIVVVR